MKRFIAFDFGAGTTCVSEFTGWDSSGKLMFNEMNILRKAGTSTEEIPTFIGYMSDGSYAIGKTVSSSPSTMWKARAWKMRPTAATEESANLTKFFMREVFKHFYFQNQNDIDSDTSFVFAIGYPCDWSEEDERQYKVWAEDALKQLDELKTKDIDIIAIKESQAAMLYARKSMNLSVGSLNEGVLLIDIGSSTTDFTYIKGLKGLHCGIDLGANDIDVCFAEQAVNNSPASQRWYDEQIKKEKGNGIIFCNSALFELFATARCNKEQMFADDTHAYRATPIEYVDAEGEDRLCKFGKKGTMNVSYYVDEILDKGESNGYDYTSELKIFNDFWKELKCKKQSWRKHLRDILSIVKNKWQLNDNTSIVITGGASRMDFIQADVQSVFGNSVSIKVSDDNNKSFSVVRGLAYVAYISHEIESARKKLKSCCYDIASKVTKNIRSNLASSIGRRIRAQTIQCLREKSDWVTANSIVADIKYKLNTIFYNGSHGTTVNINEEAITYSQEYNSIIESLKKHIGNYDVESKTIWISYPTQRLCSNEYTFSMIRGEICIGGFFSIRPDTYFGNVLGNPWQRAINAIERYLSDSSIDCWIWDNSDENFVFKQVEEELMKFFHRYVSILAGNVIIENQD